MLLFQGNAYADLVVKQTSNAPTLKIGKSLPQKHKFDLPEGAQVLLERTQTGTPYKVYGPFRGTLESYVKTCSGWLAFTYSFCKGGAQLEVGGTRGQEK